MEGANANPAVGDEGEMSQAGHLPILHSLELSSSELNVRERVSQSSISGATGITVSNKRKGKKQIVDTRLKDTPAVSHSVFGTSETASGHETANDDGLVYQPLLQYAAANANAAALINGQAQGEAAATDDDEVEPEDCPLIDNLHHTVHDRKNIEMARRIEILTAENNLLRMSMGEIGVAVPVDDDSENKPPQVIDNPSAHGHCHRHSNLSSTNRPLERIALHNSANLMDSRKNPIYPPMEQLTHQKSWETTSSFQVYDDSPSTSVTSPNTTPRKARSIADIRSTVLAASPVKYGPRVTESPTIPVKANRKPRIIVPLSAIEYLSALPSAGRNSEARRTLSQYSSRSTLASDASDDSAITSLDIYRNLQAMFADKGGIPESIVNAVPELKQIQEDEANHTTSFKGPTPFLGGARARKQQKITKQVLEHMISFIATEKKSMEDEIQQLRIDHLQELEQVQSDAVKQLDDLVAEKTSELRDEADDYKMEADSAAADVEHLKQLFNEQAPQMQALRNLIIHTAGPRNSAEELDAYNLMLREAGLRELPGVQPDTTINIAAEASIICEALRPHVTDVSVLDDVQQRLTAISVNATNQQSKIFQHVQLLMIEIDHARCKALKQVEFHQAMNKRWEKEFVGVVQRAGYNFHGGRHLGQVKKFGIWKAPANTSATTHTENAEGPSSPAGAYIGL